MSENQRLWFELGSVLVLISGLVLVSVQIKQSTDITRVQLETTVQHNWRSVDTTRQSEEFARVLAKSIERPQDLTLAEYFELDAYYLGVLDQLETVANQLEQGYREGSLESMFTNNARIYFGNAFAKAWVKTHFTQVTASNREWGQSILAIIEEVDSNGSQARYLEVMEQIE